MDAVTEARRPASGAPPARRSTSSAWFPSFDGLRGLAALSVLVFHVGEFSAVHDRFAASIVSRLDEGVPVFFVISGFLMSRPFVDAQTRRRPAPGGARYARRRILRIYPAYWVALLVSVYVMGQGVLAGVSGKIEHLALVQTYFHWPHGTALTPAWTLVVEVTFYAVLPLYAATLRRLGRDAPAPLVHALGAVAVIGLGTVVQLVYAAGFTLPVPLRILPLYAPMFGWGMLLAALSVWVAGRDDDGPRALAWLGEHAFVSWAFGLGCFAVMCAAIGTTPPLALHDSQVAALFVLGGLIGLGLVLPAALGPPERGLVRRFLQARPVAFLGTVSYAFYLWHLPLISELAQHHTYRHAAGFLMLFLAGTVVSLVVATLSWYVLERPLIRLSARSWRFGPRARARVDDARP